jgi:hypothetical protein
MLFYKGDNCVNSKKLFDQKKINSFLILLRDTGSIDYLVCLIIYLIEL